MTVHIRFAGCETTQSLALPTEGQAQLWDDFQQYLRTGEPQGNSYMLVNGRQEVAVRFASVATMTKTSGDERGRQAG